MKSFGIVLILASILVVGCAQSQRSPVTALAAASPAPPASSSLRPVKIVSPEVLPDHRATFRVLAPKAAEASVFGEWMAPNTPAPMSRNNQGVWSVTLGPLEPGLHIYSFTVDGVTMPDPVNPRIKLRARTSASLVDVPGHPPELWQTRDVPHGTVEINWRKSQVIGDTRAFEVYTPPDYTLQAAARYPVLYLLHGNNDTAAGWTDVGKANFILDNLLAEKKALPMIMVMPWGHAVPYDGPQAGNTAVFERHLIEEIIPAVEAKYRVAPGRENRAIAGLSMGGGQSLQIGLDHLELFSAVGVFSSAAPPNFPTRFKTLLDDPDGTNAKLKQFWIGCGRQDPAFTRVQQTLALLHSHQIKTTFYSTEGRHEFAVWRKCLTELAPLLFQP